MTERQINTLVDSIIGDNEFVVVVLDDEDVYFKTQDGDWVGAYHGERNFFLWPEFVESNGVFHMLKEEDQIELLYGLYHRISSIVKEHVPNPSILDSLEYCCKLTGGYLFSVFIQEET